MTRRITFKEAFCREVALRDMFLGKFTISVSRYLKLIRDPRGLTFLSLSVLLLFAADPNGLKTTHGPVFALLIWIISAGFYVNVIYVVIGGLAVLQHKLRLPAVYTPLSSSLALFFVFGCIQAFIAWVTRNPCGPDLLPLFANILIIGLTLETFFTRFVLQPNDDNDALKPPSHDLIKIGDRQFPVTNISYLNAQEHYVQVTLINETLMIRGRIGEAVVQMDETHGIQPHRSWWVSKRAEPIMSRQNGKTTLTLNDGTEVPVAKIRVNDVQGWLDRHRTW